MANNDFLPFGTGAGANVLPQSAYAALASRQTGFLSGIAKSVELNKVWRQSAFMSSVLAQFISNQTGLDVLDDGDSAALESKLRAAILAYIRAQAASEIAAGTLKLSTTSQAQAWADDSTALTPKKLADAFSGPNQILAPTGSQPLPGGLLFQWGVQASAASGNTSAFFPVVFTGGTLAVFGTGLNVAGNIQAYVTLNSYTNGGATFNCFYAPSGTAPSLVPTVNGVSLRWFALGKA